MLVLLLSEVGDDCDWTHTLECDILPNVGGRLFTIATMPIFIFSRIMELTAKPVNTRYHKMSLTGMHSVNSTHHNNAESCFCSVIGKKVIEQIQELNSLGHMSRMNDNYVTSYNGSSMYADQLGENYNK